MNEKIRSYLQGVEYVYLGLGAYAGKQTWKIMKKKKPTIFLRELLHKTFRSTYVLANRCLNVLKVTSQLPGRDRIKPASPRRLELTLGILS